MTLTVARTNIYLICLNVSAANLRYVVGRTRVFLSMCCLRNTCCSTLIAVCTLLTFEPATTYIYNPPRIYNGTEHLYLCSVNDVAHLYVNCGVLDFSHKCHPSPRKA